MDHVPPVADVCTVPLTVLAAKLAAGVLSPVTVTEAMLDRIARLDPGLRSYLTITADLALEQARAAEQEIAQGRYRGPLHGVPIAVKDLCRTAGIVTTAGMALHREFVPEDDATVVVRLRDAGAVLLGKLHMTEGATIDHHPELPAPVNPWRADLWTGVSSSGSGVATAASLCFASLGSDTGGSIRYPSLCNGLTGVKPTWGRVSRHGVFDLAASFDTVGPMARSAADCAAVLGAIAGDDPADPTTILDPVPDYLAALDGVWGARGLRIGVDAAFNAAGASAEVMAALETIAGLLARLGALIRPITFPDPAPLLEHLLAMQTAELATAHRATFPAQADRYGPWLRGAIEAGRTADPLSIGAGVTERNLFRGRLARVFTEVDAILAPVLPGGTPTWAEAASLFADTPLDFFKFTAPLNASGSPTVTFPCGLAEDGRPIGLQLIGRHAGEATLLRAVHAIQQASAFHLAQPMLA